jgi:hypothetical protein
MKPGVPTIGCTVDAVGFFWNMALIAISVLLLMWNYVVMYTKPPKTPSVPPHDAESLKKKTDEVESPRPQTDTSMATLQYFAVLVLLNE